MAAILVAIVSMVVENLAAPNVVEITEPSLILS
jgi:hypothetical protein